MKRRDFIKNGTLATAAGIQILNFPIFGKAAPSNKVILAVMGLNSRGSYLAKSYAQLPNVEIAYICDVEDGAIKNGFDALKSASRKPILVKDIRELVKKNDFDGLVIAAPDHWHTPATILGVSHGKNVYVEKPCGHNPAEGEMLVQAMSRYGKLIQMGNQRRSMPTLIEAVKEVREGAIGEPYLGKAWYANDRKSIGKGIVVPVPPTLDYELWQGPAPRREYKNNLIHYNWHWFWNWGTGEACNNGTHEIDCCRWFLGVDYPTRVVSSGGRYAFQDDWQTPDTQIASFEFGSKKAITWEGRSCNKFPVEGSGRGFIIYGDKGTLVNLGAADYKIYDLSNKVMKEVKGEMAADPTNPVSATGNLDFYHFENFVNSIRGEAKLNSPVNEAQKSVLLCHLANISQRTSRALNCDDKNGHILQDEEAMKLWSREYEKGWAPDMPKA
jgi:predicted dehydrogenase